MLIWFAALTACPAPLAQGFNDAQSNTLGRVFKRTATTWWGPVLWTLPLAAIGNCTKMGF
jgi:hypothetical protein